MNTFNVHFLLAGIFALCSTTGCREKTPQPDPALSNIDLLRGDIILCSGKKLGEVSFPLACRDSMRETFDLGLALLHSFEYEEAEKAFVKVIDADPHCAMAYWGVAMSQFTALWAPPGKEKLEKGSRVLKIAAALPKSEQEAAYLDAIDAYYKDWEQVDAKTRASRFEQKMEALYNKYRADPEAAIFYALALNATADPTDTTYAHQRKAGQILEPLFLRKPNHPGIAHYIIHSYDNPVLAIRALPTARQYAAIAPGSAHAQHMPSHIFTRLGLWEEAIQSNINSTTAAQCYAQSAGMDGHWDEEFHGMDYLVYAYLQKGDNGKAIALDRYLNTIKKVYPVNFKEAYALAAIPARIALENKDWESAAGLELSSIQFPWERFPWQRAILHFARALGAIHLGHKQQAETELSTLQTLQQQLLDKKNAYEANQVAIQIKTVQAWLQWANGKNAAAETLMREAADAEDHTAKHPVTPCEVIPARELLGDLLLAMHHYAEALMAYETDLKGHPNRFNGLYGAAVASKNLGKQREAKGYFEQLIQLTGAIHTDRREIPEARVAVGHL